jgi:hypothetical protein
MTILSGNHGNSNREEQVVIAGTVRPNFLRDDFPEGAEWVRIERTQHGKCCRLSLRALVELGNLQLIPGAERFVALTKEEE